MASNKSITGKGKRRTVSTDATSTTGKQVRIESNATGSRTSSESGGTSNQLNHRATVATEEEDAALHGDDVVIEETNNSSGKESDAESSEAELGKLNT